MQRHEGKEVSYPQAQTHAHQTQEEEFKTDAG
jgi:hypothetical protein